LKINLILGFVWEFVCNNRLWTVLAHARFFRRKYQQIAYFQSTSIWLGIKDFYDVVLENTFYIVVDKGDEMIF